jgi:uncharacterized protein YeaO (DUF488 family)
MLTVYHHNSIHKYPNYSERYRCELDESGKLFVYKLDFHDGSKHLTAVFSSFDYFTID